MKTAKISAIGVALLAAPVLPAIACATLEEETPRPKDAVVVTDESAVIVWDAANQREHFIRGANFKGAARDIGFIVPSPSTPELKAADASAFYTLKKTLEPNVEHRTKWDIQWSLFFSGKKIRNTFNAAGNSMTAHDDAKSTSTKTGVQVLRSQSVAGYNATTLKADNVSALNGWLNKNGYVAKADFREWLEPYVQNGWVVTAFKVRKNSPNQKQLSLSPVRMSFQTKKPFYPYREPSGARQGLAKSTPRSLRVFFIGDQRVSGTIGDKTKRAWPGQAKWSDELDSHLNDGQRASLAKQLALKPEQISASARLTSFDDLSSPRPGFDEVYFSTSDEQQTLLPKPIVVEKKRDLLIPLDLLFLGSIPLFFIGRGWWRKRNT